MVKPNSQTDTVVKKAQRQLFNLKRLKKIGLSPKAFSVLQEHHQEHHSLVRQVHRR